MDEVGSAPVVEREPSNRELFVRGFLGLLPLWIAAIPIGIAYGVAAQGLGVGSSTPHATA